LGPPDRRGDCVGKRQQSLLLVTFGVDYLLTEQ
jgi:hypothetical protein